MIFLGFLLVHRFLQNSEIGCSGGFLIFGNIHVSLMIQVVFFFVSIGEGILFKSL